MKTGLLNHCLMAGLGLWLASCEVSSTTASLKSADDSSTLCRTGSQCLIYTKQSDDAITGLYWIQPGNHVHRLVSCDLESAKALSGITRTPIQVSQSDIDSSDVQTNPMIGCLKGTGEAELDSRFSLDDPVYRVQFEDYYYVTFDQRLYYKLNINSCDRLLRSWSVDSNRYIETLDTEPADYPIREFHCSSQEPDEPTMPAVDRSRVGWHVYKVSGYLDLSNMSSDQIIDSYWLEYVWPDQNRSPLIVARVRKQGQSFDLQPFEADHPQELIESLLGTLQVPLDATFSFPDDIFASDDFRAIASDFVYAPVVVFNVDTQRIESFPDLAPGQLAAAAAVTPDDPSIPLVTEFFKPLQFGSGSNAPLQWQKLLFAGGMEAKAVTAVVTDDAPFSSNPDISAPPRSQKVQYVFESCSGQSLDSILGTSVNEPAATSNQTAFTRRENVRRLYSKLQTSRVDKVYKYPCLTKPVCEVAIQKPEDLRAASLGGGPLAACSQRIETLVMKISQDLILQDGINQTGLEFRREAMRVRFPSLTQLKLVADKPTTLANRCLLCLRASANGCSLDGTAAIPLMNFSGFAKVTIRNLDLRLSPPIGAQFAYQQAGLEIENGELELDRVSISNESNGRTFGSYAAFRKALCSYNSTIYMNQSQLEGEQFSIQSFRSRLFMNGSPAQKSNRNLPSFIDDLAYFPMEQKEANRMIIRNRLTDGLAVKAIDSTLVGTNAAIEASHVGIELSGDRGESSISGPGWDFYGPMAKGTDKSFDPTLPAHASKGIQFIGSSRSISQLSFGRYIGFSNFVYFPYGEKVAGANRIYLYDSIGTSPHRTNSNLSNGEQAFRNGELICQGNCEKAN